MGKTVEEYIAGLEDWQSEIVAELRALVKKTAPDASEAVKWAQPVFESNGPFAFIKAHKKHVNFGFWRGAELDDPDGLLQGDGVKMRHVKLTSTDEIARKRFVAFVKQAVELNAEKGNPTRKDS